jgi:NAD(P)-dependent dehydrogenase (short-subunit alcohol dehydrogenase family)
MAQSTPVAFITGGGGGIGSGLAKAALEKGWRVAIADISEKSVAAVASTLSSTDRSRFTTAVFDVREPQAWENAADAVERTLGPVTHLFNNAAVIGGASLLDGGGIDRLSVEEWRWACAVNLDGVFFGLKTFVPRMRNSRLPSHITNTASMAALTPLRVQGAIPLSYAATKAAVAHMTAQLRTDLALEGVRNIGLSVIYPGSVRSRMRSISFAMAPGTESLFIGGDDDLKDGGIDNVMAGRHVLRCIERGYFHIITHADWKKNTLAYRAELDASFIESADPGFTDGVADYVDLSHVPGGRVAQ